MRIDLTCPVELWHCKMPTPAEPMLTMQQRAVTAIREHDAKVAAGKKIIAGETLPIQP